MYSEKEVGDPWRRKVKLRLDNYDVECEDWVL